MMTDSVGSFSPGFRVPAWMLLVKASTTPWARLRCFFFGTTTVGADMGAAAVFLPGTVIPDAALALLEHLNKRLGFAQRVAE